MNCFREKFEKKKNSEPKLCGIWCHIPSLFPILFNIIQIESPHEHKVNLNNGYVHKQKKNTASNSTVRWVSPF